ncbi:MAG: substrate-binding domain-containing protein, partial [Ruminococcus sp.]|nr:substrate-binding domain-containing protein [Ruminococcus sp.]
AGVAQGGSSEEAAAAGGRTMTAEEQQAMIASFFIEGERCATQDAAYEEAKKILTSNNDIKVFYATNTNTTLGVCQAIDELGLADTITVVGFNSDEQELKYIRTGVLDGTIIQNPYNMGYLGVRYGIQAANGEGVAGSLDTGVTWISAKNINDDDIQILLYPEKT